MSFDTNAAIVFFAAQMVDGQRREIAIYQQPGNAQYTVSRADGDPDVFEADFCEDETHATLHQAYASVLRNHLNVPL